jgi:hypothetical protein
MIGFLQDSTGRLAKDTLSVDHSRGRAVCVRATEGLFVDLLAGAAAHDVGSGDELESVAVEVAGDLDVRGTLAIDAGVPVGFQALRMSVHVGVAEGTPQRLVDRLVQGADRLCVNLATLRRGVPVETDYSVVTSSPTTATDSPNSRLD